MGSGKKDGRKGSGLTLSTAAFIDPNAGSKGLTELSNVAVNERGMLMFDGLYWP
jgi:hypothetical protein